jgi:Bacterial CdiA-CT RNAse A domain
MVIDQNNAQITNWLSKAKPGSTRNFEVDTLGEVTGRQLTREDWENKLPSKPVLGARVVIRADPAAPNGYYILTSFPTGIDAATWLP